MFYLCLYKYIAPVIDKGSFVPRPSVITRDNKRIKIGTPVYVYSGFDVIIDCKFLGGTPPVNITWFRNGSLDPTRGNVSTIRITDASNGDVFKCRADNIIGFDTENTTVYVEYGKCACMYICTYVHTYRSVCYDVCVIICALCCVVCVCAMMYVCVCVCVCVCVLSYVRCVVLCVLVTMCVMIHLCVFWCVMCVCGI